MGFLARAVERKASDPLAIWAEILRAGLKSKAGPTVNLDNAFRVSAFFAGVRVLCNGVAQVPFKPYQETEVNGLTKILPAKKHPLYDLMAVMPNDWTTSFEFRETLVLHCAVAGRAIAFKNVGLGGKILELIWLEPGKVQVEQKDDWTLQYKVTGKSGAVQIFPAEAIWHVRGPSWNGFDGMDVLRLAREALGLAIATEETHSNLHAKGVKTSGTYSVEGSLDRKQYDDLKAWLLKENAGADNSGLPMILDRGAKWLNTAMSGLDAQHLETRRFQIEEVCRFLGVMPIMVGYSDKATTYASSEQMFLAHVVHTLAPWYARIEQSADAHLLTKKERAEGYYFKFTAAGLLRGASKDRGEYFGKALGAGGSPAWMTQDEVRALEEMNPMGGDAAMLPKPPAPPAAPSPDPAEKTRMDDLERKFVEMKSLPVAAPSVNVTLNQEPVNLKVESAPVTVHTPAITNEGATINVDAKAAPVAPPSVQVDVHVPPAPAPTVNVDVQPAKVDVNVKATMPARKTTSTTDIRREDGEIVQSRTESIEKDA